jgi:hypothetical protein
MLDRIALTRRAAEVRRTIFASLPWDLRFAIVFTQIASESGRVTPLGRLLGAYFLLAGIEGMPDPGPRWKPESAKPADTLPIGYMAKFMADTYGLLLKTWHDPAIAEDAITNFLLKLKAGKVTLKPGTSMASAESYCRSGIVWEGKTLVREKLREEAHNQSIEDVDEDSKSISRDIEDPASMTRFKHRLNPKMWREWMDYLAQNVHPDIPLYFEKRLEGFDNEEILGVPKEGIPSMLPHWKGSPQNWKNYGPKIQLKSVEFFKKKSPGEDFDARDLAELYSEGHPAV